MVRSLYDAVTTRSVTPLSRALPRVATHRLSNQKVIA
jgi:hypothetical protein